MEGLFFGQVESLIRSGERVTAELVRLQLGGSAIIVYVHGHGGGCVKFALMTQRGEARIFRSVDAADNALNQLGFDRYLVTRGNLCDDLDA